MSGYLIRAARAEDEEACWEVEAACWSAFHSEATEEDYYDPALHVLAELDGRVVATGNAVPFFRYQGDEASLATVGWGQVQEDWRRAVESGPLERTPARFASAIGISVLPEARASGLGFELLEALRELTRAAGYEALLAPVRPSLKFRMPGLPYADYAKVRLPDGRHFDPWLRLHERAGGVIVAACEHSFTMSGSHEDWQRWSGFGLPLDGSVLLSGANEPLLLAAGQGTLTEGSIWVRHALS